MTDELTKLERLLDKHVRAVLKEARSLERRWDRLGAAEYKRHQRLERHMTRIETIVQNWRTDQVALRKHKERNK